MGPRCRQSKHSLFPGCETSSRNIFRFFSSCFLFADAMIYVFIKTRIKKVFFSRSLTAENCGCPQIKLASAPILSQISKCLLKTLTYCLNKDGRATLFTQNDMLRFFSSRFLTSRRRGSEYTQVHIIWKVQCAVAFPLNPMASKQMKIG